MTILSLIVLLGLASYRATYLIRYDKITAPIRNYVWSWFPAKWIEIPKMRRRRGLSDQDLIPVVRDNETFVASAKGFFLGELLACHWCISAYVTAALTFIVSFSFVLGFNVWLLIWFASWGVACFLLDKTLQ